MNFLTFEILKIKDVKIYLHWTWVVTMMFVAYLNPNMFLYILPVYFFVLLHELGHVFAGKSLNIKTHSIYMFPFGGVANMRLPAGNSKKEFLITLAGPAVNFGFFLIFILCQIFTPKDYWLLNQFILLNFALFVFNLLPLFPMDGGRLLRCFIHYLVKDYYKATKWAVRIGQVLSAILLFFAFYYGAIMLAIICIFVMAGGEMELKSLNSSHLK